MPCAPGRVTEHAVKHGRKGAQKHRSRDCGRRFVEMRQKGLSARTTVLTTSCSPRRSCFQDDPQMRHVPGP